MSLFDRLRKKTPKGSTPQPAPDPVKMPAIPNIQAASQLDGIGSALTALNNAGSASKTLGDSVKDRLGMNGGSGEAGKAAPKKKFGERANDWVEQRIAGADKFISDNTFGGKNRGFNFMLKAYDKVMNAKDDLSDWGQNMKHKIKNSSFGLTMGEAKNWIKKKFASDPSKPGMMDKIRNSSFGLTMGEAGKWAKNKFKKAGNKIRNSTFALNLGEAKNAIKKKFASDPNKPGLMDKIKNSSFGLTMGEAGKWAKDKFKKAGNKIRNSRLALNLGEAKDWVKGKVNKAADWIGDKKDRFVGFMDDFKDQLAAHDDERYEKHRTEKYGAEYLRQKAAYEMMLKNGEIGQNINELADVDSLLGPEQETSFTDDVKDMISNDRENSHDSKLTKLGIGTSVGSFGGKQLINKFGNKIYSDPFSDSLDATKSAIRLGVLSKEHSNLKKLSDDQVTSGATDERDKRKLGEARGAMMSRLNRERVSEASNFIGSTAKAIGGFADGGTGIGKNVGKVVGAVSSIGGSVITGKMRDADDLKIAKNAVFGSVDNYNTIKDQFGLLRGRDMRIGMNNAANARNIGDIAERARYDRAKTVNKYRGKGEAGYNMLQARGYTDKGINAMTDEDTAKELGLNHSTKRMRRRTRKKAYIG